MHGEPYKDGDTVWLIDTVVDKDQSRKFHHPWKGSYQIVKKVFDCDYHIKSSDGQCKQIVHFNRLKLCTPGTQFYQHLLADHQSQSQISPKTAQPMALPRTVRDDLELLDGDDTCTHRPLKTLHPPSRFDDFLSH